MKINQHVGIYTYIPHILWMFFFVVKSWSFQNPPKKSEVFCKKCMVLAGFKSSRFTIIVWMEVGRWLGICMYNPQTDGVWGVCTMYIPGILSRGKKKPANWRVILYKILPIPPVHLENQNNPLIGPTSWWSPLLDYPLKLLDFRGTQLFSPKCRWQADGLHIGEKPHPKWREGNRKNVPWQMHRSGGQLLVFLGAQTGQSSG